MNRDVVITHDLIWVLHLFAALGGAVVHAAANKIAIACKSTAYSCISFTRNKWYHDDFEAVTAKCRND